MAPVGEGPGVDAGHEFPSGRTRPRRNARDRHDASARDRSTSGALGNSRTQWT